MRERERAAARHLKESEQRHAARVDLFAKQLARPRPLQKAEAALRGRCGAESGNEPFYSGRRG
jgi:hypothetical protein